MEKILARGATFDYFAFGLRVRSELPLPDLAPVAADDGDAAHVTIRFGDVARGVSDPRLTAPTFEIGTNDFYFEVPDIARYRVRGGKEIVIDAAAASTPHDIRVFVTSTALGAICHQRGLLPLHASAVEIGGRCVAFVGRTYAGKSTLATYLGSRGHRILCDDLCAVSSDDTGMPRAWPGTMQVKLWREALEALGQSCDGLEAVRDGLEKYRLPIASASSRQALPLERIYMLSQAALPDQKGIFPLAGAEALRVVLHNTYRGHFVAPLGQTQSHFSQCTRVLRHTRVYRAARSWGFDAFAAEAAAIEAHVLADEPAAAISACQ